MLKSATPPSTAQSNDYNNLYTVISANRELAKRGGDELVGRYLRTIVAHGLEHTIGMRLLHKHNDLLPDEIMLEIGNHDDEGFLLVTAATTSQSDPNLQPNSWRASKDGMKPVEYSHGELVQQLPHDQIAALFEELTQQLVADGMDDLLGPSLNYSEYVSSFAPSDDAALLEKTDYAHRANVVRWVARNDVEFKNSAKTKWYAKKSIDESGQLIWMTACNCFCSVFPAGGHQGTTTHQYHPDSPAEREREAPPPDLS